MTDPAIAVIHHLSGAYNAMLYDLDRTEANQARAVLITLLEQAIVLGGSSPIDEHWYAVSCERARGRVLRQRTQQWARATS